MAGCRKHSDGKSRDAFTMSMTPPAFRNYITIHAISCELRVEVAWLMLVVFVDTFVYIHISYFMTIKCCTHYINKSLHSFTIALCVYMQANTYSILLNRAH